MTNSNVKVIYKKITKDFEKKGFINLNHRLINSNEDLVEIAKIFRNPCYETFRIVYTKDNKIVGYESITSKTPTQVNLFTKDNTGKIKAEKNYYKINDRIKRLQANGYYMLHNHTSGVSTPSSIDLNTTQNFAQKVQGFKGHLILGIDNYSWIDIDNKGNTKVKDSIPLKQNKVDKMSKILNKKSIYNMKIHCRDDLVYLLYHLKNSKDFSSAILTDCRGGIRMILDIPNKMLNMNTEQLNGYFKNLARLNGVDRVFFVTQDNNAYKKSLEHLQYGTFLDSLYYKTKDNRIYICDTQNVINDSKKHKLFEDLSISTGVLHIAEEKNSYKFTMEDLQGINTKYDESFDTYLPIELEDVPKKKLRILYKEVGKVPEIKIIDDTLKAKQDLVGGLIEVIPYNNLLIICNEEGKINNLPPNLVFDYDYIAGNCFIVGDDYTKGGFKSLTRDEIIKTRDDLMYKSFRYKVPTNNERNHLEKEREREI